MFAWATIVAKGLSLLDGLIGIFSHAQIEKGGEAKSRVKGFEEHAEDVAVSDKIRRANRDHGDNIGRL